MPELLLDENHHYTLDGRPLDGLTSTIQEAGLMGNFGGEWYLERGTAIHLATELWDKGTLDESTIDVRINGSLESWKRFRGDQGYAPIHIEYKTYHPELLVGCKIDRLPGPIDLKSGSPEPWHILQIAFQWACLRIHRMDNFEWRNPLDVYLDPDGGPPKLRAYTQIEMREAFKVYCSMLHFLRWKREKGIK